MALTLEQICENGQITADRFGYAAISYIFKAFGDDIRSKEYWPWGDTVNFPWDNKYAENNNSKNAAQSNYLTKAMRCIREASDRIKEVNTIEIKTKTKNDINALKKRLSRVNISLKKSKENIKNVNYTSNNFKDHMDIITNQ